MGWEYLALRAKSWSSSCVSIPQVYCRQQLLSAYFPYMVMRDIALQRAASSTICAHDCPSSLTLACCWLCSVVGLQGGDRLRIFAHYVLGRLIFLFFVCHPGTLATCDGQAYLRNRYPNRDLITTEGQMVGASLWSSRRKGSCVVLPTRRVLE